MVGLRMTVHTTGYTSAVRKLTKTDPPLESRTVRWAMEQIGKVGEQQAKLAAPRGATGGLLAGITHKVDKKPVPRWTVIKDTARARRAAKRQSKKARAGLAPLRMVGGYRYPGKLNWMRAYKKSGKPNIHYGWFTRAMVTTKLRVTPILNQAGKLLQQDWERG